MFKDLHQPVSRPRAHAATRSFAPARAVAAFGLLPLLLGPPVIGAQATPLDSIARLALERNLGLRQAREAERQSGFAVRQARGLFLPSLGVEARYSQLSGAIDIGNAINPAYAALNQLIGRDQFPTNIHQTLPFKQETKLRSTLPLFNGALVANIAGARAIRDLRGAERAAAARRLDADARLAYLHYASAVRAVEIWDATLPVLAENQRVAERLLSAGTLTGDAVYRARATRAEGEQQRAEAVQSRGAALGGLNLLLDRDGETPVPMLSDSLLPAPLPITLADALASSQRREERAQASAGAATARAQRQAANGTFLPSVALAADYGVQGKDYRFNTNHDAAIASVVVSWNLFNGGQDAMRREQAASAQRAMALRAAQTDRMIAYDVRTAFDAVDVAREGLVAAAARSEAARRAFQLVDRRFNEGLATHLEWSEARAQLTAAELNLVLSRYSLTARAVDLERAAALREISP